MNHEDRIAELERVTELHTRLLAMAGETTAMVAETQKSMIEQQRRFAEQQRELADADRHHTVKMSEFDDKLAALIDLLDRRIREGGL